MSNEIVLIYGKDNCPYCVEAKKLSETNGLKFEYKNVLEGDNRSELLQIVPDAKTVPQIFVRGKHVGGFDDFSVYCQDNMVEYGVIR